jgi:hypothetical protein
MISQAECRSHAALCTLLARQEPTNRFVWSAEAEYWLRLSKERSRVKEISRSEARATITFGALARWMPKAGRSLLRQRRTVDIATGATNAFAHAALRAVRLFVHLAALVLLVGSLISKWLRGDRGNSSESHCSKQCSSTKSGRSSRIFEGSPENATWFSDQSVVLVVAPQRTNIRTAKVTTATSVGFLLGHS